MPRQRTTATDRRSTRSVSAGQRATAQERRLGGRISGWDGTLHEFVVQKPYCAPCRKRVFTALNPYGIPVFRYEEWEDTISIMDAAAIWKIELKTFENLKYGPAGIGFLPMAQAARFNVPANRARWAYYLLRSSGLLAVVKGDKREWQSDSAADHLPTAWDKTAGIKAAVNLEFSPLVPPGAGKAWIESGCDSANELWKQIQQIKDSEVKRRNK